MKKITPSTLKPSAKVIDGILVLSLPDAVTPVVWKMDFGATKASAIEVRAGNNDNHDLVLKTPKADAYTIASYDKASLATRALMAITTAMNNSQGHINPYKGNGLPVPIYSQPRARKSAGNIILKTLKWLFLLLAVIALLFVASIAVPLFFGGSDNTTQITQTTRAPAMRTQDDNSTARSSVGEPVSADDFLLGR